MSEQTEESLVYDQPWYERFKEAGSFEAYDYLSGDKSKREVEKRKFLAGEVENPTLDYPNLIAEDWKQREGKLLLLKHDVIDQESNETVKQAYRWRINEKIAEVRMMQAAVKGDARRFIRYGRFIYGQPSAEIFAFTVNELRDKAEQNVGSNNPLVKQAAIDLLVTLPENFLISATPNLPDQVISDKVRAVTFQEFGDLINLPASEGG